MKNFLGYLKLTSFRLSSLILTATVFLSLTAFPLITTVKQVHSQELESLVKSASFLDYTLDSQSLRVNSTTKLTTTSERNIPIRQYTLTVPFTKIDNASLKVNNNDVNFTVKPIDNGSDIDINLGQIMLNKDGEISITLSFIVQKPLIAENDFSAQIPVQFNENQTSELSLKVLKQYRYVRSTSTYPTSQNEDDRYKYFHFKSIATDNLTMLFGKTVNYNYSIDKYVENPDEVAIDYEITLPRTQHNQTTLINSMSPLPEFSYIDDDQNIVLRYRLEPQSKQQIKVNGSISMIDNLSLNSPSLFDKRKLVKSEQYWELEQDLKNEFDLYIQSAGSDKSKYPRLAATFVKNMLDHSKVNKNAQRSGAIKSLKNREIISVEDYSDMTIALLRHLEIPTQMVIGYVSILHDMDSKPFAHTWVEYYQNDQWHILDPYIEDLNRSESLGNSLLDHIAFVTRATSPLTPKITNFGENELNISLSQTNNIETLSIDTLTQFSPANEFQSFALGTLSITNNGNSIIIPKRLLEGDVSFIDSNNVILVPGQTVEIRVRAELKPGRELRTSQDLSFTVEAHSLSGQSERVVVEDHILIKNYWWSSALYKLLSFTTFLILLIVVYNFLILIKKLRLRN